MLCDIDAAHEINLKAMIVFGPELCIQFIKLRMSRI